MRRLLIALAVVVVAGGIIVAWLGWPDRARLPIAGAQAAEIVAAATIGLADVYGLPVSTTHVLSSGVAGAMAANGSGLQWSTIRNMALAWVMTLPAAMAIAGSLFVIFRQLF